MERETTGIILILVLILILVTVLIFVSILIFVLVPLLVSIHLHTKTAATMDRETTRIVLILVLILILVTVLLCSYHLSPQKRQQLRSTDKQLGFSSLSLSSLPSLSLSRHYPCPPPSYHSPAQKTAAMMDRETTMKSYGG